MMASQTRRVVGSCFHFRPESVVGTLNCLNIRPESPEDLSAVTLVDIFEALVSYFNEIVTLQEYKKKAEKECNIREENEDCWSDDDIRRVWGKTKIIEKDIIRRNNLALVIFLQLIERHKIDMSLLIKDGYIVQRPEDRESEEDTSDQCWPIYGVRQSRSGTERLVFDQNTENSPDAPSGHSWKRVEVESENKEDGGTAGGDAQRKPERINSEGRSPQINTDLGSVGDAQSSTGNNRNGVASGSEDQTIYIRIPLAAMLPNEQTPREYEAPPVTFPYKLIDGFPSDTDLRIRKSYGMSFDNITNNANWVYEILNVETLAINPVQQGVFGHPYHRGHLAAAANHRWCREARNDADLSSNIAPQHWRLNNGLWKTLENKCRKLTEGNRNVHVYSGPLYLTQMNPRTLLGKTVPSHFFKVIIVENEDETLERVECYLVANRPTETDIPYRLTVRHFIQNLEEVSGLTFIEPTPNVREERTITVRLQGEGVSGEPHHANIQARICQNN